MSGDGPTWTRWWTLDWEASGLNYSIKRECKYGFGREDGVKGLALLGPGPHALLGPGVNIFHASEGSFVRSLITASLR